MTGFKKYPFGKKFKTWTEVKKENKKINWDKDNWFHNIESDLDATQTKKK